MNNQDIYQKLIAFTASVYQVHAAVTKDVKLEDITLVQYRILELLAVSPPLTLSQVAECMNMSMPNTSREVKKLSEKNLCERNTDTDDRRKHYIQLSSQGTDVMSEAFKAIESAFAQRIKEKSEASLDEINQALNILQSKVFFSKP